MPTSLQYPLERSRDLQRHWERLLRRYPMPHWSFGLVTTLINTIPPRDPDDDDDNDDDEKDDEEVDREPAVIREPDKDE
jgi:hypothetical protein